MNNIPASPLDLFVFGYYEVQDIEGKLLTLVESIGLPVKQEEAIKSLVRQSVWNVVERPHRIWLSQEMVEKAYQEQEARKLKIPQYPAPKKAR